MEHKNYRKKQLCPKGPCDQPIDMCPSPPEEEERPCPAPHTYTLCKGLKPRDLFARDKVAIVTITSVTPLTTATDPGTVVDLPPYSQPPSGLIPGRVNGADPTLDTLVKIGTGFIAARTWEAHGTQLP